MYDVSVIGGINTDIEGRPDAHLIMNDSNPGSITFGYGGVGRNIAENCCRMGAHTAMISVTGDNYMCRGAVSYLENLGMNTDGIKIIRNSSGAVYLSLLDSDGDMKVALNDMNILRHLDTGWIEKHMHILENSGVIAVDCNGEKKMLEDAAEMLSHKKLFLDPVSAAKAVKIKDVLGYFHTVKPNRIEAEVLTGVKINSKEDLVYAGEKMMDKGVRQVYISLGSCGVFFMDSKERGIISPKKADVISATGAGDAFSAAAVLAMIDGTDISYGAALGMAAASIAIETAGAVNVNIKFEEVKRRAEKYVRKIFRY